jgi:nicotinate-nucleotide pyrophosphorylase (carboxylating)
MTQIPDYLVEQDIKKVVAAALAEDLGGELTPNMDITASLIPSDKVAIARIITREPMTMCGTLWAEHCFKLIDPSLKIEWSVRDGQEAQANETLFCVKGNARAILTAERSALNFIQTLSATATVSRYYSDLLANSNTRILDTRKTLPGLRNAQKYAVLCGGGSNHRIGLHDAFLIKENHIIACGGIKGAVSSAKENYPGKPVEVEVESLDELESAIEAGADIVMLDNFSIELVEQAVVQANGRCKLEVSGNIVEEDLKQLAKSGVNFVSSGALTKHIKAIDLSLRLVMED